MRRIFLFLLNAIVGTTLAFSSAWSASCDIGVYYFPGWNDASYGQNENGGWDKVKPFADRKPLKGWYREGAREVMEQQISEMRDYGIGYVVFDWYFKRGGQVHIDHALKAFLSAQNSHEIRFSLLWANHEGAPGDLSDWDKMVRYWIVNYFPYSNYLQIDGKPVIFVFSTENLERDANRISSTKVLFDRAQKMARDAGLAGIYFVGDTHKDLRDVVGGSLNPGYSAMSAYNYAGAPRANRQSHSYAELAGDYSLHWDDAAEFSQSPYIVPITAGWDRSPWGGTTADPLHDNSRGTAVEFGRHLRQAKRFMDRHPRLTNRMAVICCWNEYGEGSYIEPTTGDRFTYLEQIRSVFKK